MGHAQGYDGKPMPGLTPDQIDAFWREGFVSPLPALDPLAAKHLRDWVETFERDFPNERWAFNLKSNLLFESIDRLVRLDALLDPVEDIIGPNLLISTATFRIKEPRSPGYYGRHQDDRFIQTDPCWVQVFLAVTECTIDNGCLAIVPGRHREPFMEARLDSNDHDNALTRQPSIARVDDDRVFHMTLAAGEIGLFHCHAVHGSGRNHTDDRRIGLILDYFPTCARQSEGQGSATLVRGIDDHGHFATERRPRGEFTEDNILSRREVLYAYPNNVYFGPTAPGTRPRFPDRATD